MKQLIIGILFILLLAMPVNALDIQAPEAPDSAMEYMPDTPDSFGEGVWYIIRKAITSTQPLLTEGIRVCLSLIALVLLLSIMRSYTTGVQKITSLAATVAIAVILLESVHSMVNLGTTVVTELSEYGKLFVPVMTTALAAQGGITAASTLYTGTILFNTILSGLITRLLVPLIYVYLCLCIACNAIGEFLLQRLRDLVKWIITWGLKLILYIFTGYMTISGVVSGTADASAIKATKLAVGGLVPVVGSILSDASEAILVSAGVLRSAAGLYGLFALLAIMVGPFIRVGIHHLLLKATAAICDVIGGKNICGLIQDFSTAMGFILGMIGTMFLLLLISTVCFLKGVR